jgi:hypothetical protein
LIQTSEGLQPMAFKGFDPNAVGGECQILRS